MPTSCLPQKSVEIGSRGPESTSGSSLAHRLFRQRREGILKYDLDGLGPAAAFRREAERRVDVDDPRPAYCDCNPASHFTARSRQEMASAPARSRRPQLYQKTNLSRRAH